MHRLFAFVAAFLLVAGGSAAAAAQEATPAAQSATLTPYLGDLPEGIGIELLGGGLPTRVSGPGLALLRMMLEPDAVIPAQNFPSAFVLAVESGAIAITPLKGVMQITHVGTSGVPATPETIGYGGGFTGVQVVLRQGDSLYSDVASILAAQNVGEDTAVVIVSMHFDAGQPPVQFIEPPKR